MNASEAGRSPPGRLSLLFCPVSERGVNQLPTIVVVGAQWGDEAKGKIVDLLSQQARMVVRYGGGSNAGHTVTVGESVLKLHLTPSGILHPSTCCIISDGVVIDPAVLIRELDELDERGVDTQGLRLSPYAHVVLPYHREIDRLEEERKGAARLGTTGQGVGPAYEDKARRCGLRIEELVEPDRLRDRLPALIAEKNRILTRLYDASPLDGDVMLEQYLEYGAALRPFVADTSALVQRAVAADEAVVFEGAQGTLLDIDCGTYPFVTSSHPIAGGACLGAGIGPRSIDHVLGICKAYTTRVGAGAFPTELLDSTGELIRMRGNEFGTTTGRPRRVGWLDLVVLRYSAGVNGMSSLAVTLLDVLSSLPEIQVCTGYRWQGELLRDLPFDRRKLNDVEPVYETLPGWESEIGHIRSYRDLPDNARRYVERISEVVGLPVSIVSVGKRRDETIWCDSAPAAFVPALEALSRSGV